ncbi:hypothetical protein [Tenggerimyces flavus]|uniref:Uncharacterized protein n=1 Tax=Tenggerimyces flavus TaxID=1708749 RepID=A0ABV7YKN7_9ACTN|nr:hypothetical protein [Tenggerimyces flavus]MBM7784863.1 hypothetical protein [Tenggerimyces flavus]
MTEATGTTQTPKRSNVGRALLWAAVFTLGLYAVVFLIALAIAWPHDTNPNGGCEGIGWGCALPPRDGVIFFGLIGVPFIAAGAGIAWVFVLLGQLVEQIRQWRGIVLGGVAAALVVATGLVLAGIQLLL